MSGYRGPGTGDGPDNAIGQRRGLWYASAAWPIWQAGGSGSRILTPAGQGIQGSSAVGWWLGFVFWQSADTTGTRFLLMAGAVGARGYQIFRGAGTTMSARTLTNTGVSVTVTRSTIVTNAFNAGLAWHDVADGFIRFEFNAGAQTQAAADTYGVPLGSERMALVGRSDAASNSWQTGGLHAVVGGADLIPDATQRAAFFTYARQYGIGNYGLGGSADNPVAEHKWVAHDLTDSVGGVSGTKSGAVNDNFELKVLAW